MLFSVSRLLPMYRRRCFCFRNSPAREPCRRYRHGSEYRINRRSNPLSWKGLIRSGFAYGVQKGLINDKQAENWKTQIDSNDLDDLLGAAEFMGRKLGAPNGDLYARWLKGTFKSVEPGNADLAKALHSLTAAKIPLCTLNYDHLLEHVTGLPAINLAETAKVTGWMRRKFQAFSTSLAHGMPRRPAFWEFAVIRPPSRTMCGILSSAVSDLSGACYSLAAAISSGIQTSPR